jgi:hypothetical protein
MQLSSQQLLQAHFKALQEFGVAFEPDERMFNFENTQRKK